MQLNENNQTRIPSGLIAGFITGVGFVATAWIIATRPGRPNRADSVSILLDRCDKQAHNLEQSVCPVAEIDSTSTGNSSAKK